MDKNLPTSAGDMGSIPALGRFHMPPSGSAVHHNLQAHALEATNHKYWAYVLQLLKLMLVHLWAHIQQLLSPRATAAEVCMPRAYALQQEKPPQWEAHALQLESCPHSLQLEKACAKQQKPSTAKIKNKHATPPKKNTQMTNMA